MTMSDEDLPAPVGGDISTTSSVAETPDVPNPAEDPPPCLMTSGEVGGVGSADSDSGGSLSSSASPAPLPNTVTHDEWNANEPSDGADSGVGANGSTPVDGESLSLSFDGPVTTGSPLLSPPFVPAHYPAVPPALHPSCVTMASVVGNNGQPSVMPTPVVSHPPVVEDMPDGCTVTTGSSANVMPPGSAAAAAAAAAPNQQYVVNVHVNAGETFSVRAGDRVQLIHGNYLPFDYFCYFSPLCDANMRIFYHMLFSVNVICCGIFLTARVGLLRVFLRFFLQCRIRQLH